MILEALEMCVEGGRVGPQLVYLDITIMGLEVAGMKGVNGMRVGQRQGVGRMSVDAESLPESVMIN